MKNETFTLPRLLIAIAVTALVSLGLISLGPVTAHAQSLSYSSGQPVVPGYEGWQEDADGSKYFLFGYMNRNWEEELDIPVGADNGFAPGNADQGQPTHFLPRRNRFVFRVPVPKSFTDKDELIWTITSKGKTEKAYASLRADYKVDDVVKASETGALGAGTSSPKVRANKAPIVKIDGEQTRTVKVGQRLSLTTLVTDDGVPRAFTEAELTAAFVARARAASAAAAASLPGEGAGGRGAAAASGGASASGATAAPAAPPSAARFNPAMLPPTRVTVGKNLGLHLSWFVYRGAGKVHFSPEQVKAWEDTRAGANSPWAPIWFAPPMPADNRIAVDVTFDEPGTYVLRALADDGALTTGENVTVTVTR
jgi:autonomous glycyl radical cofactor GrcA